MNTKRFLCAALGAVCYFAFLQAQVRTEPVSYTHLTLPTSDLV